MATGRQAFQRDSVVQTLNAIIEHDPPPLAELNPSFPAPARWIAERCLSKAPADRYASTLDLARELRGVREHLSEASNSSADPRPVLLVSVPAPPRSGPPRRLRAWHVVATSAALARGALAVPAIRESVLERFHLLPMPAEKCVAVLPVECLVTTAEEKAACAGLLDSVTSRLGALQRHRQGLTVVPAQEVRQSDAKRAVDALRRLSATLAVDVTVRRTGSSTAVAAVLVDARSRRELRAAERSFVTRQASLVDETVDAVVGMLDMELSPREQTALTAGSHRDPPASRLYLEAVGLTPYQLGQTALERADQQPSVDAAIKLFNKALELEPGYALAHVGLGRAYLSLYQIQNRPEYAELAEDRCNRANELDRLMPQAWLDARGAPHAAPRVRSGARGPQARARSRPCATTWCSRASRSSTSSSGATLKPSKPTSRRSRSHRIRGGLTATTAHS